MYDCQCVYVILVSFCISAIVLDSTGNGKGCYYKGSYHHGNWTDGCEFNCSCLDAEKGHYKCQARCPVYPQLPAGCVLKLPSGEKCCEQPDCSAITSHNNNNNNSDNGSNNNGKGINNTNSSNISDYNVNNSSSNGESDDNLERIMSPKKSLNYSSTDNGDEKGCLYNGKYHHGNWTDGCKFNCTCEDPVYGLYRCRKRCKEYIELDPGCVLEQSSADGCCKVPVCNSTQALQNLNKTSEIKTTIKSITLTTLPPILVDFRGVTNVQPSGLDNDQSVAYITTSDSNKSKNSSTEVIDAKKTEELAIIFSRFGPIKLFTVRNNMNAKSMTPNERNNSIETTTASREEQKGVIQSSKEVFNTRKDEQLQNVTESEGFTFETGGVCLYKGINFTQGEQWYDGCDFICMCENATRGFYKCRSRCQKYNALPLGCVMRESNTDSCCLIPDCRFAAVTSHKQQLASPTILPKIQELGREQKSTLKRLFNQRIQMRNKSPHTEKDKMFSVEGKRDVPIFITPSKIDKSKQKSRNDHIFEQINNYSDDILQALRNTNDINSPQGENRLVENLRQNTNTEISNRTVHRQEIVTPFSVSKSDLRTGSSIRTEDVVKDGVNGGKSESHRTIATETGIYKVRKKDGIITAYRKPMSSVLRRKVGMALPGKITSEFCNYKNKRFHEGESWFDGCELACFCQSNGQHSCQKRCPEYSRMPAGCYLVKPRAGQCCSLQVCRQIPSRNHPPASYLNL